MLATAYASDHSCNCPCDLCAKDEARHWSRVAAAIDALPEEIRARIEDLLTDAIYDAAYVAGADPDDITRDDAWRALSAVCAARLPTAQARESV